MNTYAHDTMRNVSVKVVEKLKIHTLLCSVTFSELRSVREIMWEEYGRATETTDDNIIRHMRFECWIIKATDRHLEYVILLAFAR
jgi:hypothetical protein